MTDIDASEGEWRSTPPSAPSHFLPNAALASVEFPGPVRSISAAQECIQQQEIEACFNGLSKILEIKLRPREYYSIPIRGTKLPVQRLLLLVKRRRRRSAVNHQEADSGGIFTSAMTGPINSTVRFRSFADYQYTPDMSAPVARLIGALHDLDYDAILGHSFREPSESFFEPVGGNTATMRDAYRSTVEILPPPISSVKVLPNTYSVKSTAPGQIEVVPDDRHGGYRRRLVNRAKYIGVSMQQVTHVHEIPQKPDSSADDRRSVLQPNLVVKLQKLLEERPMWGRQALMNQLDIEEQRSVVNDKAYLPTVGYTFVDGPFRSLTIRFGYDPTVETEARQYQRVQFTNAAITQAARRRPGLDVADGGPRFGHLTAWDAEQIRRAELGQRGPLNPARSHIFDGQELHRARGEYQWCDVTDPLVKQLVAEATVTNYCDPTDGWFTPSQHDALKAILRLKFRYLEQNLPAPDSLCADLVAEFKAAASGGTVSRAPRPMPEMESESDTDAQDDSVLASAGKLVIAESKTRGNTKGRLRPAAPPTASSRYRSALMPEQQMAMRLMREVRRDKANAS